MPVDEALAYCFELQSTHSPQRSRTGMRLGKVLAHFEARKSLLQPSKPVPGSQLALPQFPGAQGPFSPNAFLPPYGRLS
jgi:hypothetical protein